MELLWTITSTLLFLNTVVAQSSSNTSSVLNLGYARYQGLYNATIGITGYYGLRYAAPPVGDYRWQPPKAIETVMTPSSSIINATARGPICPQAAPPWSPIMNSNLATANLSLDSGATFVPPKSKQIDEDCLSVDVVVPNAPGSTALPIVIQIHGGGYVQGDGSQATGENIVAQSNGTLISVSIQYRLGIYGFLAGDEVSNNGTLNAGLLDQRLAIEWVQRHAFMFGGDPSKVTITGGSAGGGSVSCQLILYGGDPNPPFRAAMPEFPWFQPYHTNSVLARQYRYLLQAANCTDLPCLRGLDQNSLAIAGNKTYELAYNASQYGYGDYYYGPSVDGHIIRDLPSNEYKQGHFSKVPMLIDHDSFEGLSFTNFSLKTESNSLVDLEALWSPSMVLPSSSSFFARVQQLYPSTSFASAPVSTYFQDHTFAANASTLFPALANNTVYWQTQAIFGDFIINCPTYYMASALSSYQMPVYKLIYNGVKPLHAGVMPYAFNPPESTDNSTLATILASYYRNFIVNLDPNVASSSSASSSRQPLVWPLYQDTTGSAMLSNSSLATANGAAGSFQILQVNQTAVYVTTDSDASVRCDFWHGQSYVVRN